MALIVPVPPLEICCSPPFKELTVPVPPPEITWEPPFKELTVPVPPLEIFIKSPEASVGKVLVCPAPTLITAASALPKIKSSTNSNDCGKLTYSNGFALLLTICNCDFPSVGSFCIATAIGAIVLTKFIPITNAASIWLLFFLFTLMLRIFYSPLLS